MMNLRRIVLVTLICLAVVVGLLVAIRTAGAAAAKPKAGKGVTLLVHSGAALRPALDELGKVFQSRTGVKVDYNYKGSACLLPDVCMSQQGDAYIPGEVYFMEQALDRKIVKPDYQVVATMTTVLVVQPGNPKKIKGVQDLARTGIRLGLGDPKAVAIGRAAREVLVKAKVWDRAQRNLVMSGLNTTELTNAIKLRQLDASIVWDATAALYGSTDLEVISIPTQYAVCSPVPAGVVAFTKHAPESKQYVDFLASPEATKVFVKHGFGAPPKPKPNACNTTHRSAPVRRGALRRTVGKPS
jgi:molybdate transport system substrate-binding protein